MADDSMFDKMVEMGMGMAMVNQIPRMMGSVITPQECAQTPPPVSQSNKLEMYASINGSPSGPYTEDEFIILIQKGLVNNQTLVWKSGMTSWLPAKQVPEAGKLIILHSKL